MSHPLDNLKRKAEQETVTDNLKRRPTWAPVLILGDELGALVYELKWLSQEDKPVGRLWATFTDPRRGAVTCEGFQLRAGLKHNGKKILTAPFFDKPAVIARLNKGIANAKNSLARDAYTEALHHTEARTGGWSIEPGWVSSLALRQRITELAGKRVTDFCGASEEQMKAAGRFCGHCCICGKGLTDPISLELGIGPECRTRQGVSAEQAPGAWIIGGSNATGEMGNG